MNKKLLAVSILLACSTMSPARMYAAGEQKWDKKIVAHTNTWMILLADNQIDEVFSKAGDIQICDFLFFNPRDNKENRQKKAMQLATRLDNYFRTKLNASGNCKDAVSLMARLLDNSDQTLSWFANGVDELYTFLGE